MPSITAEQLKQYTDIISAELKSDDPAKLVEALLKFGEFLGEQFPGKSNEEIQKELKKSGITFDSYTLAELELVRLGAMNGIATAYYSDRDDKCEDMLAKGDDSLLRTYKAWKIATVVFAYFVGESSQGDLFAGLQAKVREKSDEWASKVSSQVDKVVEEDSANKNAIIKLQNICKQYQELITVEMKQAALALPQAQLVLLKDEKGRIDIEKVLKLADRDVHKHPALYKAKIQYLAILTLNDPINDQKKTFSARLERFCSLAKNAQIKDTLTSNSAEKSLWDSFLHIIRAVRISGTAGFFHSSKKMQADTQLKEVMASLPKPRL